MKTTPLPLVHVYFDPVSPYAWLALRDLQRKFGNEHGAASAALAYVPVLFAALLDTHATSGPAEVPAKRGYLYRDVMREAARRGLPFAGPPGHPFNPLLPLRMCTAVEDQARRGRLALAFAVACWEDGRDITNPTIARTVAEEAGCDGALLLRHAGAAAAKTALAAATEGAAAAGVFGVPTFRIDGSDELFWGADRIDALLWRLAGNGIDDAALAAFTARPPLAMRKR